MTDRAPAYQDRYFGWTRQLHSITFYAELWREPQDDPALPALAKKYGAQKAESELSFLNTHLLREVVNAAGGLLYTLDKIERLMAELQTFVDEEVEPLPADQPWPEGGFGVSHPLVIEASFEFVNFLSWLRTVDERLDRPGPPGRSQPREGLLPSLANRPLRPKVQALVETFRKDAVERTLANYALHAGVIPQPLGGASITPEHKVALPIPDRPKDRRVATRWHLTFQEEREALGVAREAGEATESLVDGLIDAFTDEAKAIEAERQQARQR